MLLDGCWNILAKINKFSILPESESIAMIYKPSIINHVDFLTKKPRKLAYGLGLRDMNHRSKAND
jgi:ribosomal protein L30/L7E